MAASAQPTLPASPSPAECLTERLAERRVALVHDWLTGMRVGEKVLEAIANLFPEAPIYTLVHIQGSVSDALESHPIHTSYLQRAPGIQRHYRHYLPLFPSAIEDFDLSAYDLILSTSHCVAKGVIPSPAAHHVCYCHTPMRYAWDQEHTYFPRRRGMVARLRQLVLSNLRSWDAAASPRVDHFIANSRFVARRIARYYGRQAAVVAPPVDIDFFQSDKLDSDSPKPDDPRYCLIVTALAPYKRIELAIEACQRLGRELRIVGDGPERQRLERLAGPQTQILGRIDGDDLRRLFLGADIFLQPGLEDFGIAPVEALACGTPVVALGYGGVLDIVEDGVHGVLYRPLAAASREAEVDALCVAIDKSRQISFNKLELRARASDFSSQRFAERYLSQVTEAL